VGRLHDHTFATSVAKAEWRVERPDRVWQTRAQVAVGAVTLGAPLQELFLLGGRGTLPGHDFRSFVGHRFWLARLEASRPLVPPWVGLRTFAAVGATRRGDATVTDEWAMHDSGGLRASVGAGLTFGWNVLRVDAARGLRDGRWEVVFSVDPRFTPWL
jgi:hemolysin activation/secretion protein